MERAEHLAISLAKYFDHLSMIVQNLGAGGLIALLSIPILIAVTTRNVTKVFWTMLLSLISLLLLIAPASANNALGVLTALGSFMVALHSLFAGKREKALSRQVAELTLRVGELESAEQRRLTADLRRQHMSVSSERRAGIDVEVVEKEASS